MDTGSNKHGVRLDEQLAKEIRDEPGAGRTEEWREPDPEANADRLQPGGGAPAGMTAEERDERSRVGQYLRRTAFPADRPSLLTEARAMNAPDDVITRIEDLPDGQLFDNVADLWAAGSGSSEAGLEPRF